MKIMIESTSMDDCWVLNKIIYINYLAFPNSKYLINVGYYYYYTYQHHKDWCNWVSVF